MAVTLRRVIFTGGRDYQGAAARWTVTQVLTGLDRTVVAVHGGAPGCDRLVDAVATELGIPTDVLAADWKGLGRRAGVVRNQAMLDAGATAVIAFPGGVGTADMTRRALRAKVPVGLAQLCGCLVAPWPEIRPWPNGTCTAHRSRQPVTEVFVLGSVRVISHESCCQPELALSHAYRDLPAALTGAGENWAWEVNVAEPRVAAWEGRRGTEMGSIVRLPIETGT